MTTVVEGLPQLNWTNGPGQVDTTGPGSFVLTAKGGTDWTNDAFGAPQQHAATSLGFVPDGDFTLSARVAVSGERTTFDAAVLAIWGDQDHWAKICFEFSPQGQPMVVSVVTDVFSDDCNSTPVDDAHVFLRVLRAGRGWAFHSSADGVRWDFVRTFRLDFDGPVSVGFMAQAPMGDTCVASFDAVEFRESVPGNLRDGS